MNRGFTLIELLIVLGFIISIISLLMFVIKPVEIFKKNRDFQRINDLKNLELAINIYLLANPNSDLDGIYGFTGYDESNPTIFVSLPYDTQFLSFATMTDGNGKVWDIIQNASSTSLTSINGNGWLPINFTEVKIPPITSLPVDPINSYENKLFYSYAFVRKTKEFELNANLEYSAYKYRGDQDKTSIDGGSDNEIYEAGTNKCIIVGNRLYGDNISTTTCAKSVGYYGEIFYSTSRVTKLDSGEWLLYLHPASGPDELISTDTSPVHDANLGTGILLFHPTSVLYVLHDLNGIYYVDTLKVYGNAGSIGDNGCIEYWNISSANWESATCTSFHYDPYVELGISINTSTNKWRFICQSYLCTISLLEMEARGFPKYWSRYFEHSSIVYDIKKSKESDNYYYLIAGSKNNNFWFVKLTLNGDIKFATSIGNSDIDLLHSIETEDINNDGFVDYYILGGITYSYGTGTPTSSNGYLIKIATSGDIIYRQSYGDELNDSIKEIRKNINSDYFAIGNFQDPVSSVTNLWFFKISSSTGSVLNEIKLENNIETIGSSFVFINTSSVLAGGRQRENSYITKIDLDTFSYQFGLNYPTSSVIEEIVRLREDKFSNYILALVKIFDLASQKYYFQVRKINPYDGSFNILINYFQPSLNEVAYDFIQDNKGNIVVVGYSQYCPTTCLIPNLSIYKFNSNGNLIFKKYYNGGVGYAIEESFGIGYIVGGYSYNTKSGWVMYINEDGECVNCFTKLKGSILFNYIANIFNLISRLLKFLPL